MEGSAKDYCYQLEAVNCPSCHGSDHVMSNCSGHVAVASADAVTIFGQIGEFGFSRSQLA